MRNIVGWGRAGDASEFRNDDGGTAPSWEPQHKQTSEQKKLSFYLCHGCCAGRNAEQTRWFRAPVWTTRPKRQQQHSNLSPDSVRHMLVSIVVEVVVTPVRPVCALRSPKTLLRRLKCRKQIAKNEQTSGNKMNGLQQDQPNTTQPMISCIPSSISSPQPG